MSKLEGTGVGVPLAFQCWKCRRQKGYREPVDELSEGRVSRVRLTGKTRPVAFVATECDRSGVLEREYACLDCGHVGWSRHIGLRLAIHGSAFEGTGVMVTVEPPDCPWGGEVCLVCKKLTKYWWGEGCSPLCQECAKTTTDPEMRRISKRHRLGPIPKEDTTIRKE